MAMKVKEVIEILSKFPLESLCYAYEGEVTGIIIVSNDNVFLGEILTGGELIQHKFLFNDGSLEEGDDHR